MVSERVADATRDRLRQVVSRNSSRCGPCGAVGAVRSSYVEELGRGKPRNRRSTACRCLAGTTRGAVCAARLSYAKDFGEESRAIGDRLRAGAQREQLAVRSARCGGFGALRSSYARTSARKATIGDRRRAGVRRERRSEGSASDTCGGSAGCVRTASNPTSACGSREDVGDIRFDFLEDVGSADRLMFGLGGSAR